MLTELTAPPITEVACGVIFSAVQGLDAVAAGRFQASRNDAYPTHEVHPLLFEGEELALQAPFPTRVWLVSVDRSFILQIQANRFYLNWRATGGAYPRFNDHSTPAGGERGVLTRFLKEFHDFSVFSQVDLRQQLAVHTIEVTKVDTLEEGRHWTGFEDLSQVLPVLGSCLSLLRVPGAKQPQLVLRMVQPGESERLTVSASLEIASPRSDVPARLQLETSIRKTFVGAGLDDLVSAFRNANTAVNEAFERLVPTSVRHDRFSRESR